jgi:hypothetical protein
VGEEQNRFVHVVDEFVWLFEKRAVTGDGEFGRRVCWERRAS